MTDQPRRPRLSDLPPPSNPLPGERELDLLEGPDETDELGGDPLLAVLLVMVILEIVAIVLLVILLVR